MEADFRAILAGHAPLIALVGTRIYPSTYPQGATDPAIRYQKVSGITGLHMQGSDGLTESIMQIDVRATSAASALAVRDVLVALLHPFRGIQGDTDFRLIKVDNDRGIRHEKPVDKDYYTASLDVRIWSRVA